MTKSSADRPLKRVYRFILLVALCYALVTPIWWWLSPIYSKALCQAANVLFKMNLLSQDGMTYTYADNKITSEVVFVLTQISADLEARVAARSVWEARIHHFSFTIWAALLLATPFGDWKKKVLIFFVGWAIVFGGQLFALFVETLSEKSVFLQSSAQFEQYRLPPTEEYILRWGGRFFLLIGNKLLPLLLWFAWGLPKLLRSPERAVKSREPEPTPVS